MLRATSQNSSSLSVTIDSGPIVGRLTQHPDSTTPVKQFLGIPFAQPPIDYLRFLPPELPHSWTEVCNGTSQPMAGIQYSGPEWPARDLGKRLFNTPGPPVESEDCLYLNVYVPEGGVEDKAVLFWIYGGSNRAVLLRNVCTTEPVLRQTMISSLWQSIIGCMVI